MSKRLLHLNGMAILATVLNHSQGWVLIAMFLWTNRYRQVEVPNFDQVGSLSYYFMRFIGQFVLYAIPSFIFISGYFMAFAIGPKQGRSVWKGILYRIIFLLVPYLIWASTLVADEVLLGRSQGLLGIISIFMTTTDETPLYFVPLLIQFYLLAPFIVPMAKKQWKSVLLIALVIQLFSQIIQYASALGIRSPFLPASIPNWFFPRHVFWFVSGVVIGQNTEFFKKRVLRLKWVFLALTIIFFIAGFIEWEIIFISIRHFIARLETILAGMYAASFILSFLAFSELNTPFSEGIQRIGGESYGIYLVHVPAQEYVSRLIYHIAPSFLAYPLPLFIIVFIAGLGIPLLLMSAVARSPMSRYYRYVFG